MFQFLFIFPRDFHYFKYFASSFVALHLEIPSLYIGLIYPAVQDGLWEYNVEFFRGHLLGGARAGKKWKVVVDIRETGVKGLERGASRFMHCTAHLALLSGKGVNRKK